MLLCVQDNLYSWHGWFKRHWLDLVLLFHGMVKLFLLCMLNHAGHQCQEARVCLNYRKIKSYKGFVSCSYLMFSKLRCIYVQYCLCPIFLMKGNERKCSPRSLRKPSTVFLELASELFKWKQRIYWFVTGHNKKNDVFCKFLLPRKTILNLLMATLPQFTRSPEFTSYPWGGGNEGGGGD